MALVSNKKYSSLGVHGTLVPSKQHLHVSAFFFLRRDQIHNFLHTNVMKLSGFIFPFTNLSTSTQKAGKKYVNIE